MANVSWNFPLRPHIHILWELLVWQKCMFLINKEMSPMNGSSLHHPKLKVIKVSLLLPGTYTHMAMKEFSLAVIIPLVHTGHREPLLHITSHVRSPSYLDQSDTVGLHSDKTEILNRKYNVAMDSASYAESLWQYTMDVQTTGLLWDLQVSLDYFEAEENLEIWWLWR